MPAKRKKSDYHHPDLRQALLDAAARLIKDDGLAGFSLREVAKKVGVSHAAPYRHFDSKEELLANLLVEGHRRLRLALLAAQSRHPDSPGEQLMAMSRGYLAFARESPEYLHVMFSRDGMAAAMKVYAKAKEKITFDMVEMDSFGVLENTVKQCQAVGILDPDADSGALCIYVWSGVHGLSLLRNEGILAGLAGERGMDENTALAKVLAISDAHYKHA